jgi:hypothetical protein
MQSSVRNAHMLIMPWNLLSHKLSTCVSQPIQVSSKAAKAAVTDVIFADTTVRPRKKSTLSLI